MATAGGYVRLYWPIPIKGFANKASTYVDPHIWAATFSFIFSCTLEQTSPFHSRDIDIIVTIESNQELFYPRTSNRNQRKLLNELTETRHKFYN